MKKILKYGILRKRKDGISEYIIVSSDPVKNILIKLLDHVRLKKNLLKLVLKIIEDKKNIKSENDLTV